MFRRYLRSLTVQTGEQKTMLTDDQHTCSTGQENAVLTDDQHTCSTGQENTVLTDDQHTCSTGEQKAMLTDDHKNLGASQEVDDTDKDGKDSEEWRIEDKMKEIWEKEQIKLKEQLVIDNVEDWAKHRITEENCKQFPSSQPLQYIGGVDISFVKGDRHNACAALVILNYPELEVVYEDMRMVHLTAPYIAGFLAFREADFLVDQVNQLRENQPEYMPQVIIVDGNGILHPRGLGLASHIGVLLDLPTIGAAKNLFHVDGLEKDEAHQEKINALQKAGDYFPLVGSSGKTLGMALKTCERAKNPIFVSPGHKLSLETAAWVVQITSKFRVPEPTRQADQRSREYLRMNWKDETSSDCNREQMLNE